MSNYEHDKLLDQVLCECYAYVDERRATIEGDHDDFDDDSQPEVIAYEERSLGDMIMAALKTIRNSRGYDERRPLP